MPGILFTGAPQGPLVQLLERRMWTLPPSIPLSLNQDSPTGLLRRPSETGKLLQLQPLKDYNAPYCSPKGSAPSGTLLAGTIQQMPGKTGRALA